MALLLSIRGTEVRVLRDETFQTRGAVLAEIFGEAAQNKPFSDGGVLELLVDTSDKGDIGSSLRIAGDREQELFVPDPHSVAWPEAFVPSVEALTQQLNDLGRLPFEKDKAVWIGAPTHPSRECFNTLADSPVLASRVDAWFISWTAQGCGPGYLSLPDHVRYRYLIDIEGNGFSGRLKWLLCSRRPVFVLDRPLWDWITARLRPWEHYIPVARDGSDFSERLAWADEHPEEALAIAERAALTVLPQLRRSAVVNACARLLR
jgi:hypothetical protein